MEIDTTNLKPWLDGKPFGFWKDQFDRDGYLIFKRVLPSEKINAIKQVLTPYLEQDLAGRNDFEGLKSNRIYGLLAKSPIFADLALHPLALTFAEVDLKPSLLLSACLAINIHPGETVQPWHHDDSHMQTPLPRESWGVSAFWAIDPLTEENGATEILPGSHKWSESDFAGTVSVETFRDTSVRPSSDDPGARDDALKVTMPKGSLMIAKGTLWHRGGANRSDKTRLIITPQYCVGWARQLENMIAAIPLDTVKNLPKRAQELIGYSIHPPFMGYVDGMHPNRLLEH